MSGIDRNTGELPEVQTEELPDAGDILWIFLNESSFDNISFIQYHNLSSNHTFFISHDYLTAVCIDNFGLTDDQDCNLSSIYERLLFRPFEIEEELSDVLSIIHEATLSNSYYNPF